MKCGWIENRLSIETDGYTRACCLETDNAARISHINSGINNSFNSKILLQLRDDLSTGFNEKTKPFCNRCAELEFNKEPSLRTTTSFLSDQRELKYLQFKLSNQCQLACAHCGSERSSTWAKINNENPHVKKAFHITDSFINELKGILPTLSVIKFSGGEPFLQPEHWKILEALKSEHRSNCELHYITNGISPFRQELWEGWKNINCSISVDGFEKSYEWFRRGSNWDMLLQNINKLKKYSNVSINYSITPYTISDYLKAKEFWSDKYHFSEFSIVYPDHCSMLKFPLRYITKLKNFEKIPYTSSCATTGDIHIFREWAKKSDLYWNTIDQSKKLFWWMND
jgi:organic radical activating enzyme